MKQPRAVVVDDRRFSVPPRIQRLPGGWQVRYRGTLMFSDRKQGGPQGSFDAAVDELNRRYQAHSPKVATSVRCEPLRHKTSDLPAGISGPVLVHKPNRAPYAEFKVSLPRCGRPNAGTSVYIANEAGWSAQRYDAALAKAIKLRDAAVDQFNFKRGTP